MNDTHLVGEAHVKLTGNNFRKTFVQRILQKTKVAEKILYIKMWCGEQWALERFQLSTHMKAYGQIKQAPSGLLKAFL
jgi:hypothetical protein